MTRRERVINALMHGDCDMVPYQLDFTMQAYDNIVKYTGDKDFVNHTGTHIHVYHYWGWPTQIEEGSELYRDDFQVLWNRSGADKDIGVIDHPVIKEPDLSLKPKPILDEARLRREIEAHIASKGDCFVACSLGFSVFERLWSYCGMEDALVYMLLEPDFVHGLLDEICAFNLKVIDIFNEYPIDGVLFGDDWGQQRGLIMGAGLWREFIKPRVARMYAHAKKDGKFIMQHSCGDISEVFEDLIEIGLDCYQTFQPEIYDIEKVKQQYGDRLAFWGGISTQQLLPNSTPQRVKEETKRIMDIMSKSGGYIAAPTHAIPFDIPPQNILAMLEVFQNQ